MSRENVEIVRRIHEVMQRETDPGTGFDRCVREGLLDASMEWGGGARRGRAVAGMENVVGRDDYLEMLRKFGEDFEDLSLEAEQIIDAGADRVVAIFRALGTGRASGAPVEMRMAWVFWLDALRVVRIDPYLEPNDALKAVGLRDQAMSQENVELVERVVAAVNERDVDGYLACCVDDIKLRTPWAAVEGVYEGPDAIRRFFADLQDWAPDFRLTIDRAEPIGATRVLVLLRASLSGRASGLPAVAMSGGLGDAGDLSTATVYDCGKVTSIRVFLDRDQALKAVGLAEPAPQGGENPEPRA
jgi:ketosteroid isomerase-like protein